MLLVEDDEAGPRQRREQRRTRSHHDVGGAVEHPAPLVVALPCRQRAVQNRDALAEARHEAPERLRRERDLRHEHDHAETLRQRLGRDTQIDLGLSACGDAVKQEVLVASERGGDGVDRRTLRLA